MDCDFLVRWGLDCEASLWRLTPVIGSVRRNLLPA